MIRRLRPLLTLVVAGAIAGAPLTALGASAPAAVDEETSTEITGVISDASPTVVESDSTLSITTTLDADSSAAYAGRQVHLRITDKALRSHAKIAEFLDSPESFGRHTVAEEMLADHTSTDAEEGTSVTLSAEAADLGLPKRRAGVYGVTVTVIGADGAVTVDSMVITWAPVDLPDLQIATVATVTGSATRAAALMEAADTTGVTLLVDPALETNVPTSAAELFRMPAGNADLTSLARAGDSSLIEYAVGDANSDASAVLRYSSLLAPVAVADRPTLRAAMAAGVEAVILEPRFDADGVRGGGDAAVVDVTLGDDSITVVRPDEELSEILRAGSMDVVSGASRMVAETAVTALYGDEDLVVVSPGQSWTLGDGTESALDAMLEAPWVEAVPLSTALDAEDLPTGKPASKKTDTGDDLDTESVSELAAALEGVQVIASTATDPTATLQYYALDLLRAVSLPSRAGLGTRAALVSGALTTAEEAIGGVSVATSSDINFIAAEGELPVTVRNTTAQELTVIVAAASNSPELQITGRPEVTIPAGSDAVVQIPVSAVSSANVVVYVTIRTVEGDIISEPQNLTVRVRADWGNAATAVFSVLLVLLLIAGVIRTIRRGRRDTRVKPSDLDAPVDETPSDTETRDNT
ncbi:DUF6049 family protein [Demequina sp. NBRC 110054]|uniref:DUF6049 family protein n=1 Tax=Demequina sp. NBRC 110054 TaxID=1570343 RepID=UPI000A003255|nr:DUF6049 family protein [Demequina sp. NBRC 110054]